MKKNFNLFQIDADKVLDLNNFSKDDFVSASDEEKENMVETHAAISYWKDAARRFKKNKVSMAALFLFIVIFLFAYVGPSLVPYNYYDQFRSSQKLGPFEYSKQEEVIKKVASENDYVYATALIPGSLNSLNKQTTYNIKIGSKTYNFYNEKMIAEAILIYNDEAPNEINVVSEKNCSNSNYTGYTIKLNDGSIEGANEIKMIKDVFPHVFGTDSNGRDLMARTMYGGRVSIAIGIIAALIVLVIGSLYGSIAGLCGGTVDFVMMRIVDLIYSVPDVLIVLLLQVILKTPLQSWLDASGTNFARLMSTLGVGIISIFITFACLYWVGMSRIVRGQVLQLKDQEFVMAAVALGVPRGRIIKRHLLPNCVGQLVIATCLQIPSAIFLESFLSFLGLGVSIPMTSLGSLCSDALDTMTIYPYRLLLPGFILTLLVLSLNLIGDGIRDALDPRLKK